MTWIEAPVLQSGGAVAPEVRTQNTTQKEAPRMSNTLVFLPLMEDALSVAGGFVLSMAMGCLFFSIRVVRFVLLPSCSFFCLVTSTCHGG